MRLAIIVVVLVLIADQVSKIWVKTHMYHDESIVVFSNWFIIHFIENPGMAFGFEFGGATGKLLLSIFRLVAITFIAIYLNKMVKSRAPKAMIVSLSLVLAGAFGNIIDSVLYGVIFSESPRYIPQIAEMFPQEGGYAGFLHGKVVDMLYFPLIDTTLPSWVPVIGGEPFQFFRPVFNIADTAISFGMGLIILNHRRFFSEPAKEVSTSPAEELQSKQHSE